MGKQIKSESDQNLAHPHKEGSTVMINQTVLHHQMGVINFGWPIHWTLHFNFANDAYEKLKDIEQKILQTEPNAKTNSRLIADAELNTASYKEGFNLVIHTYLTFEYYSLNILRYVYANSAPAILAQLEKKELSQKLRHIITKIINKPDLINNKGYSALISELQEIRHSFNHPKSSTIYNVIDWAQVPHAWVVSGKYKNCFEEVMRFFEQLKIGWEEVAVHYVPKTITLTGLQRGLKFNHQYKKPV